VFRFCKHTSLLAVVLLLLKLVQLSTASTASNSFNSFNSFQQLQQFHSQHFQQLSTAFNSFQQLQATFTRWFLCCFFCLCFAIDAASEDSCNNNLFLGCQTPLYFHVVYAIFFFLSTTRAYEKRRDAALWFIAIFMLSATAFWQLLVKQQSFLLSVVCLLLSNFAFNFPLRTPIVHTVTLTFFYLGIFLFRFVCCAVLLQPLLCF